MMTIQAYQQKDDLQKDFLNKGLTVNDAATIINQQNDYQCKIIAI